MPNIVLDECVEHLRDSADPSKLTDKTRDLGLIVARGTSITFICPDEGFIEIDNPFN